jgi:hypothetical protein
MHTYVYVYIHTHTARIAYVCKRTHTYARCISTLHVFHTYTYTHTLHVVHAYTKTRTRTHGTDARLAPTFAARQVEDGVHGAHGGGNERGLDPVVQVLLLQRVAPRVERAVRVLAIVVVRCRTGLNVVVRSPRSSDLVPAAPAATSIPVAAIAESASAEAFALCAG